MLKKILLKNFFVGVRAALAMDLGDPAGGSLAGFPWSGANIRLTARKINTQKRFGRVRSRSSRDRERSYSCARTDSFRRHLRNSLCDTGASFAINLVFWRAFFTSVGDHFHVRRRCKPVEHLRDRAGSQMNADWP